MRVGWRRSVARWGVASLALWGATARAAVTDVTPTDVTPRTFSVVWVSDQAVASAGLRVFADAAGTTEVTGSLAVSPAVVANGVVKVDVAGPAPDTCYYVQTTTTGTTTVLAPASPPFTQVCTAVAVAASDALGAPHASDLLTLPLYAPDGTTPGNGSLLVVSVQGSAHPVSAWMGQGIAPPQALVDLGRLFDAATRTTAVPAAGVPVKLTQLRGLACPGAVDHALVRYRRVPAHLEETILGFPIVEVETGTPCFFADTHCDGVVDDLDGQRVLDAFDGVPGTCVFNPDLDVVADGVIDVLDLQHVLNRHGEAVP